MRPNNLFRDPLDGQIPGQTASDWKRKVQANSNDPARIDQRRKIPSAFEVPRTRALTAQQHRGTGPAPDPLRVRGRVTRYRTKG